jgi:hypothetical protein
LAKKNWALHEKIKFFGHGQIHKFARRIFSMFGDNISGLADQKKQVIGYKRST